MWDEYLFVLLVALSGAAVIMSATFGLGRWLDNYGIVDAVWALLFAPLTLWYVVALEGDPWRQGILVVIVSIWSLRLGIHLARRIASAHPQEDLRYEELRLAWRGAVASRMFWFYQLQGLFALLLSVPLLLAAADPGAGLGVWGSAGVVLFAVALVGEAVADAQLRRFKGRGPKRTEVCRSGLWRYSRHPNYFFEWLIWVAFGLLALGSPFGWVGLISPLLMLWLLLKVTGIPPVEAQAIRSKGEAYREYQQTTSVFVPWFPRR